MERAIRKFGKVCAKHPELKGERVSNGRAHRRCAQCAREISRRSMARWRAENPERARAIARKWQGENLKKRRAHNRKSYAKNINARRERRREKYALNPAAAFAGDARRRARKANATVPLTWLEKLRIEELYEIAKARTVQTGVEHHVDHDRPLALGGLHHPDNMMVIPAAVNLAKGARYHSTMEFCLS